MEAKAKNKLEHLNSLSPLTFVEDDDIKSGFLKLYLATHAGESAEDAENFYERESNYFKRILFSNNDLRKCTMFSLYGCFMDIVVNGLSFDSSANLVYIETRNFKTSAQGQPDQWEKRASNKISPYGELTLRIKYGQIKYIDNPVIVYDGDIFKKGYGQDGKQFIIYEASIPRKGNEIVASFVKIVRPDGSFDFPHMEQHDIERLKSYSLRQNKTAANALYSANDNQIDPGFLKAKTIRHAFKAFPKVNILGANSSFDEDTTEEQVFNIPAESESAPPTSVVQSPFPQSANIAEAPKQNPGPSANGNHIPKTVTFTSDEF
jgi:recombinational DNA repair protein RecT